MKKILLFIAILFAFSLFTAGLVYARDYEWIRYAMLTLLACILLKAIWFASGELYDDFLKKTTK